MTKNNHQPGAPKCPLGKMIGKTVDVEGMKHELYQQHGVLVVAVGDERINWIERQIIKAVGDRLFRRG